MQSLPTATAEPIAIEMGHAAEPGTDDTAEELMLERIRTAAEETLVAWPEAKAAVLFGSRARGDHSADSDWDLAFIPRTGERVRPIPRGLPTEALPCRIQCLSLPD